MFALVASAAPSREMAWICVEVWSDSTRIHTVSPPYRIGSLLCVHDRLLAWIKIVNDYLGRLRCPIISGKRYEFMLKFRRDLPHESMLSPIIQEWVLFIAPPQSPLGSDQAFAAPPSGNDMNSCCESGTTFNTSLCRLSTIQERILFIARS